VRLSLPRIAKQLFLRVFPTLRIEVACAISVVGARYFVEPEGFREIPGMLVKAWHKGDYALCVITPLLLLLYAAGLALPFVWLGMGSGPRGRFRTLVVIVSTLVLLGALGWTGGQYLLDAPEGPRIGNVAVYHALAAVAFAEFAVVAFGVFQLLDDPTLVRKFAPPGRASWPLLAVTLMISGGFVMTGALGILHPATTSLAALNLVFVLGKTWPPAEALSSLSDSEDSVPPLAS